MESLLDYFTENPEISGQVFGLAYIPYEIPGFDFGFPLVCTLGRKRW